MKKDVEEKMKTAEKNYGSNLAGSPKTGLAGEDSLSPYTRVGAKRTEIASE